MFDYLNFVGEPKINFKYLKDFYIYDNSVAANGKH